MCYTWLQSEGYFTENLSWGLFFLSFALKIPIFLYIHLKNGIKEQMKEWCQKMGSKQQSYFTQKKKRILMIAEYALQDESSNKLWKIS